MGDKNYKENHKDSGLCVWCSDQAYPGRVLCLNHLRTKARSNKKYREKNRDKIRKKDKIMRAKRIKESRCLTCGGPKERDDRTCCINCREHINRERFPNEATIL